MAHIIISDLPEDVTLSREELRSIKGGVIYLSSKSMDYYGKWSNTASFSVFSYNSLDSQTGGSGGDRQY